MRWVSLTVSCAYFSQGFTMVAQRVALRVILHIRSLKMSYLVSKQRQTKMADDEGGKDTLRQFVENECKAQALRVS